jgi:competence protein ComEC
MRNTGSGIHGWLRRGCGRHPLFAVALVATACVALADGHPAWGLAAGGLLGAAGTWIAGWRSGLAWLLCGWIAVGGFAWRDGSRRSAERALTGAPGGWARARVLRDAQGSARGWSAPARLTDGGQAGAEVLWQGTGEVPVAGAVVAARGNFGPLPAPRNPGEFDRAAWLRGLGIAAVFQAEWDERVVTGRWAALGAGIRHGFRDRVTAGLAEDSEEAAVIRAVVIGESPPDADALIAAFRNSGTLHVFSVSGLHVAMVGMIGWLILSWLGVPRRWAVVALLPLVFGYSWITGNSAPAVRSAWMAAVFLGAFVFRRQPDLLNALGAVLLAAMLWDGRLLFQAGVQLSYGVVAAISVGTSMTVKTFAWLAAPEPYLPPPMMSRWQSWWLGLRRKTAQSLGASLAAGAGSAPLTAYHFGLVTPVSVLANLVLVPLVFGLLVAGLAAVALSPVAPPLARAVNRLNGLVAHVTVASAGFFAAIPGGHFHVGRERRPMLLVYDLDHGAGAACFSGGAGGAVLIDCGSRAGFKRCVMPSLRKLGIEPDSVVLSHPDGNHLGGGAAVWQAFPLRQALMPVRLSRSPSFRAWMEDGPKAGIALRPVAVPGQLAFPDGAVLEMLHAPDPDALNVIADDRVAVMRLHWRGWKLLFTSDAGMGTERKMLDSGREVAADVIIAGRHTGDLTLCDAFLDAVDPRVIIASNARFPITERLAPDTVDYWKSRGIQVLDQGETGGVTVRVDEDGNLRLEGFLNASPVVLRPR